MLRLPAEWQRRYGDNVLTATLPRLDLRLRYHERLRPQPAFSTIVERALASDREMRPHDIGKMQRLVTAEGEYGAAITIRGRRGNTQALRWIGAVFLDEFATTLDVLATAHVAEVEALSLELWRGQRFEIAARPRPFYYVPPRDWQGLPSGLVANWYPPDFPANRSMIVVPPAQIVDDPAAAIEAHATELAAGLVVEHLERDDNYVELRGRREDTIVTRAMATIVVEPRLYCLRLETLRVDRLDEVRDTFRAVAASIRPLPGLDEIQLGRAFANRIELFDHWAG